MMTLPQTVELARLSPDVDEVIAVDSNLPRSPATLAKTETARHMAHALSALRAKPFDAIISLHGRTASLAAATARGSHRVGFADEAYPGTLEARLPGGRFQRGIRKHDTGRGEQLVAEALARFAGSHASSDVHLALPAQPRIAIDDEPKERTARLLSGAGIGPLDRLVIFHVGSGYGDFKRWPANHFAELAVGLQERGLKTAIIGSGNEEELAGSIAASSPAVSLAGQTNLAQLAALLARADLLVSGDSGPLHLAAALGTPVVAIYGPTDPAVNGPIAWAGQPASVVRRDIVCSPCYSVRTPAECPLGNPVCMTLVMPNEVLERVCALVTSRRMA